MFPPESSSQFLTQRAHEDLIHLCMDHEIRLQFLLENGEILTQWARVTESQVGLAKVILGCLLFIPPHIL